MRGGPVEQGCCSAKTTQRALGPLLLHSGVAVRASRDRAPEKDFPRSHALRGNAPLATLCVGRLDAERRNERVPTRSMGTRARLLNFQFSIFNFQFSIPFLPSLSCLVCGGTVQFAGARDNAPAGTRRGGSIAVPGAPARCGRSIRGAGARNGRAGDRGLRRTADSRLSP